MGRRRSQHHWYWMGQCRGRLHRSSGLRSGWGIQVIISRGWGFVWAWWSRRQRQRRRGGDDFAVQ
ncbi:UNVERIFIED_CONTAM: hypothetical protein Sangu_3040300 [Sesamum angustifolium]|uniref:Uncharacterized protein n=1 Tax=Sesamum angustifolium TaxID=2727405 RepID=A0AAW2KHH0_9LAMI